MPSESNLQEGQPGSIAGLKKCMHRIKLDRSVQTLLSFTLIYVKLMICLPEYADILKESLGFLYRYHMLLTLLKFLPIITVKFLLAPRSTLFETKDESHFEKLENFHDILLFQKNYPNLRIWLSEFDQMFEGSWAEGDLKLQVEKHIYNFVESLKVKSELQESMIERYRKSKLAVTSLLAVAEFDFFGILKFRAEEILHL
jgi:hypothetical protein